MAAAGKPGAMLLDKDRLLRQMRRMNAKGEAEREQRRAAVEARVAELRGAAAAAAATMTRLRGDRDGGDYAAARARRDELHAEIAELMKELDPSTEFERVDAAISQAKAAVRFATGPSPMPPAGGGQQTTQHHPHPPRPSL
jgi:hypothetical protein